MRWVSHLLYYRGVRYFKYYPKIRMGCYYFTTYHVILSLQHDIHEHCDGSDDEILTPRRDAPILFSPLFMSPTNPAKCKLFPQCFCFSETEFVVLETDGCWWWKPRRGTTEREEGKDIKSYHRQ